MSLSSSHSADLTSICPDFLNSTCFRNSATASQYTPESLSPFEHTAPRTPTISGLIRANSSKSLIFRWPERAVLIPNFFPSITISLSRSSDKKSNKFLPSLVRVSIKNPSHSVSAASFSIFSAGKPL